LTGPALYSVPPSYSATKDKFYPEEEELEQPPKQQTISRRIEKTKMIFFMATPAFRDSE
jgi:hypothetical protein